MLSQLRTRIFSGEGIGYSISGGLGYNFYTLWTYYLSSPLNIIVLLLPTVSIDALMDLLIIFKIILGGTTFAWYLERKGNKDNYTIIPFALGYALSTYVLGYNFNIMWMDCLALFPMIVAGLEELIEDKTGINTMTAEEPMTCVAIGTGKFVEFLAGKRDDD